MGQAALAQLLLALLLLLPRLGAQSTAPPAAATNASGTVAATTVAGGAPANATAPPPASPASSRPTPPPFENFTLLGRRVGGFAPRVGGCAAGAVVKVHANLSGADGRVGQDDCAERGVLFGLAQDCGHVLENRSAWWPSTGNCVYQTYGTWFYLLELLVYPARLLVLRLNLGRHVVDVVGWNGTANFSVPPNATGTNEADPGVYVVGEAEGLLALEALVGNFSTAFRARGPEPPMKTAGAVVLAEIKAGACGGGVVHGSLIRAFWDYALSVYASLVPEGLLVREALELAYGARLFSAYLATCFGGALEPSAYWDRAVRLSYAVKDESWKRRLAVVFTSDSYAGLTRLHLGWPRGPDEGDPRPEQREEAFLYSSLADRVGGQVARLVLGLMTSMCTRDEMLRESVTALRDATPARLFSPCWAGMRPSAKRAADRDVYEQARALLLSASAESRADARPERDSQDFLRRGGLVARLVPEVDCLAGVDDEPPMAVLPTGPRSSFMLTRRRPTSFSAPVRDLFLGDKFYITLANGTCKTYGTPGGQSLHGVDRLDLSEGGTVCVLCGSYLVSLTSQHGLVDICLVDSLDMQARLFGPGGLVEGQPDRRYLLLMANGTMLDLRGLSGWVRPVRVGVAFVVSLCGVVALVCVAKLLGARCCGCL